MKNLKICVVGCGRMANNHLNQITKWIDKERIALCDLDIYKARLLSETFDIPNIFDSLDEVFSTFKPDICHIVTPPHVHVFLAVKCMEAGAHVYVEKPLTLTREDSETLIAASKRTNQMLCVGHNRVFEGQFEQVRDMVREGTLGKLIHLAGYDSAPFLMMEDLGLGNSWSGGMSGGMFTDLLPHLLSVFVELMPDLAVEHVRVGKVEDGRPGEMFVNLGQKNGIGAASIHYSFTTDVIQNYIRAEFEHGEVVMDVRNRFNITIRKTGLPGLIERVWFNVSRGMQLGWGAVFSVPRFLLGKADPYEGVGALIQRFYEAAATNGTSPVSDDHMRQVVELTAKAVELGFPEPPQPRLPEKLMANDSGEGPEPTVLVTGGTGFIGKHLVRGLLEEGASIRLITRRPLAEGAFQAGKGRLQLAIGQITDAAFFKESMKGIRTVYHLAAATKGDMVANVEATCRGTANLLDALADSPVEKVVYLSSVAIYDQTRFPGSGVVDEKFALEPEPLKRGAYTYAKLKAEYDVLDFMKTSKVKFDIIRPGLVWGPGKPQILLETNKKLGKKWRLVFGKRKKKLPLIYVENLVDALILSGKTKEAAPAPMNIVDMDVPDQGTYLKEVGKLTGKKQSALFLPLTPLILIAVCAEWFFRTFLGRKMSVVYKLKSKKSRAEYANQQIQSALGWRTRVPFREALARDLAENPDYL